MLLAQDSMRACLEPRPSAGSLRRLGRGALRLNHLLDDLLLLDEEGTHDPAHVHMRGDMHGGGERSAF